MRSPAPRAARRHDELRVDFDDFARSRSENAGLAATRHRASGPCARADRRAWPPAPGPASRPPPEAAPAARADAPRGGRPTRRARIRPRTSRATSASNMLVERGRDVLFERRAQIRERQPEALGMRSMRGIDGFGRAPAERLPSGRVGRRNPRPARATPSPTSRRDGVVDVGGAEVRLQQQTATAGPRRHARRTRRQTGPHPQSTPARRPSHCWCAGVRNAFRLASGSRTIAPASVCCSDQSRTVK